MPIEDIKEPDIYVLSAFKDLIKLIYLLNCAGSLLLHEGFL